MTAAAMNDIVSTLGIDLSKNVFHVIAMKPAALLSSGSDFHAQNCLNVWPTWRLV